MILGGLRRALSALLLLLLCLPAGAQDRFANGNVLRDNAGNVFYETGEYARMANGQVQYRNAGFGGAAYANRQANYPNGQLMRGSNGDLFYQNGQLARQGPALFHPNGSIARSGGGAFYANGSPAGDSITLRERFDGGSLAIVAKRGMSTAYLLLPLGDGWSLVVDLDSGGWEVTQ